MRRLRTRPGPPRAGVLAVVLPLAGAAVVVTAAPAPAATAAPLPTAPCGSRGVTAQDTELAARLNTRLTKKLRGYMDGYRVSCARAVVETVRARGLPQRAAVIAITTAIVETGIRNINREVDHDSLGVFQQRATWGSAAQRLNVAWSTGAFLDKMLRKYPDGSWRSAVVGDVCQRVQVSKYPERYQPQAGDGQIIVSALWSGPGVARAQVVARAKSWNPATAQRVPYSQTKTRGGYRTDGSGYASMALGLAKPGPITVDLAKPAYTRPIAMNQLLQGDLVIDPVGGNTARMVVIFDRWADAKRTSYWAYQQRAGYGTDHRVVTHGLRAGTQFRAYRPVNIH
uniref:Lipoprotein n=3 Tax=Planobispora rosea TaxID=35762 RepID=B5LSY8_PLARO|nr:lipoprotein [Planobispora rosea]